MATYSLAPHWAKINYQVDGVLHSQSFSVSVDNDNTGLANYDLVLRDGVSTVTFQSFITTYAALFVEIFNTVDTGFVDATLYRELATDDNPIILKVVTSAPVWNQTNPTVKAAQLSFNLYGATRSKARLTFLDVVQTPFQRTPPAQVGGPVEDLLLYYLGATCPIQTRKGEYLETASAVTVTYNDKLTQKYFNVK